MKILRGYIHQGFAVPPWSATPEKAGLKRQAYGSRESFGNTKYAAGTVQAGQQHDMEHQWRDQPFSLPEQILDVQVILITSML
ncbi:hypothetical protein SDC9_46348 [bioreactor metagenome]|uniref:Uncharacterized protein n=1 Tax=bioreactor metagenome TaxID=1076179 RepID=A0A644W8H0_9ZZZZ